MNKLVFAILLATILTTSILAHQSYADTGCRRDCEAPTFGTLDDGRIIVEKGFTINGKSFNVSGFSQMIPTQTIIVGQPVTVKMIVNENSGVGSLRYAAFSINDYKDERNQAEKAKIAFTQDFTGAQKLEVLDFDKTLENVRYNATQTDSFNTVVYLTFNFAKPIDKTSVVLDVWDESRNSRKNVLFDAIQVVEKNMEKVKEEKMMEKKTTQTKPTVKVQEEKKQEKSDKKSDFKKKPMIAKGKKKTQLSRQYQ